jgi:hypothetical protein
MYNFIYQINGYQVEIDGTLINRQTISYWRNDEDCIIEEYYGTAEEIRLGYTLANFT